MRVIQVLTTVSYGDAVSNDALSLHDILTKHGYSSSIYAENIDKRIPEGTVLPFRSLQDISKKDIIIYHLSTGTILNYWIQKQNCRKIMIYHNITPPEFFDGYSSVSVGLCSRGLHEAKMLNGTFDYVLADSEFNKQDLIRMGYECPIDVLPILIPFDDYHQLPDENVLKKYNDDWVNIIFVGRIAPNKKQEDIIAAFKCYHNYYNPKSRLFLVGSYSGMEAYHARLEEYTRKLEAEHVIFTGHIRFQEILAYYHLADVFLCMSEHEGFCVPLVEAMEFQIPIIAYDSCAIKYTLGGSGLLLESKEPMEAAAVVHRVITEEHLKTTMLMNQSERRKDFDHSIVENQFIDCLKKYMKRR